MTRHRIEAVVDLIADFGGVLILPLFSVVGILAFVSIR